METKQPDDANLAPLPSNLPWYKQPTAKLVVLRVGMRLLFLAGMVVILRLWGGTLKTWGYAYLAWITSLGEVGGPLTFLCLASLFSGLSPSGYMPSVAAGATFPYEIAIPLSYVSTVLGSLFNLFVVRVLLKQFTCLQKLGEKCAKRRRRARIGWTGALVAALLKHPIRMTALVRLPFLGNGSLNYLLSRTAIPTGPMMLGNCLGMLPGAVLFAVMGTQARSLASMIAEGQAEPNAIAVMATLFVVSSVSLLGVVWTTRRVMKKLKLAEENAAVEHEPAKEAQLAASEEPNDENHSAEAKEGHCHHRVGRLLDAPER